MTKLSIFLLGPLEIAFNNVQCVDIATDKGRALLAFLAVEADRPHRRDALTGLLWPDHPQPKARHNLRQALSSLRQAIGDRDQDVPFLLVSSETIQFNTASDHWLDVAHFKDLSEACRQHHHRDPTTCRPCLQRMVQMDRLYRADFLDQFFLSDSDTFEEWATLKRESLHQEMILALAYLADAQERRGEIDDALRYARRQVALEPWCEEAHRHVMRLLTLAGQRSAALAQYVACQQALTDELGVDPTNETKALYASIRDEQLKGPTAPRHNLPPVPTPFVGRKKPLADLAELLANPDCRLITLIGPGGIGKTRLALHAAADHVGAFEHGVYTVALAAVAAPELIVPTIASALKVSFSGNQPPEEQLLDFLREKTLLLVLDNMEHVIEGADFVARILEHAPGVVMLATSRERLNLREEWVYPVDGLTTPAERAPFAPEAYGATTLFTQCARRAHYPFTLTEQEWPAVARICRTVEGMPLGIELAAAWVPVQSCAEIAADIARNLDTLATTLRNVPARHRSLRAAFEHSWNLISAAERAVFTKLSVFRGGFEAEAALEVAEAATEALTALVDKSLLRRTPSGRYEMHELLRQYAAEKLERSPEEAVKTRDRHSQYYASFLEQRESWFQLERQEEALEEIGVEIENVRTAWQQAVAHRNLPAIGDAAVSLGIFYQIKSWNREGAAAFNQAAERLLASGAGQSTLFGQLRAWQGHFAYQLGQNDIAEEMTWESVRILRQHGDVRALAFSLYLLGKVLCYANHDYAEAEALFQESITLYEDLDDRYGLAQAMDGWGDTAIRQGQFDAARERYEQGLALHRAVGDLLGTSTALGSLGAVAGRTGDYKAAGTYFRESLDICRQIGNQRGIASGLHNLSTLAYLREDYLEAKRLRQETLGICREIGYRWGVASTLKSLGDVANRLEDYGAAMRYLRESLLLLEEMGDRSGQAFTLNSMGGVVLKLGQTDVALGDFHRALQIAMEINAPPIALSVLVGIARVLINAGDVARAAAIIAFVRHHPATEKQTRDQAVPLWDELAANLTPHEVEVIEAQARVWELGAVVELLSQRPL